MKTTIKLIAYYRVSGRKQGESGLGLEAQKHAVKEYANRLGGTLVAEYQEVETGKKANRPQLTAALAHCKLCKATLVVAKLDRLARNVAFTSALMEAGVDFVACDNPHANRMAIQLLAVFAEHEGIAISRRTKEALAVAKEVKGVKLGSARPGHWEGREDKRGWKKGTKNAAIARAKRSREAYAFLLPLILKMREAGDTWDMIATKLNDNDHQTVNGVPFNGNTVWRIVKRSETPLGDRIKSTKKRPRVEKASV